GWGGEKGGRGGGERWGEGRCGGWGGGGAHSASDAPVIGDRHRLERSRVCSALLRFAACCAAPGTRERAEFLTRPNNLCASRGRRPRSPSGAGNRVPPAPHARAGVPDILLAEKVLRFDPFHRIDRTEKGAFVAKRH